MAKNIINKWLFKRRNIMIDLFRAFTTKEDFFYEEAFIAKIKYQQFQPKSDRETYENEIVKGNSRLSAQAEIVEDTGTLWRNFSKEEIADFSHLVGDTNSIHLTENPVVQGMFILKELCDTTKANEIEVKYIHPVYGDTPVYIKHEGNLIKGYSNSRLCFQATLL